MKSKIVKLAIIGSRNFVDYSYMKSAILEHFDISSLTTIISGGATGADKLAEKFAEEYNLAKEIYYPNWKTYGRAAGPIRNKQIIDNCDACIAFPINESKGTYNAIKLCQKNNKPVIIKNSK